MTYFLKLFWRSSRFLTIVAVTGSIVEGAANAVLMGLLNRAIHQRVDSNVVPLAFVGLCALVVIASSVGRSAISRLCHDTVFEMTIALSRRVMSAPLRQLEEIGTAKQLNALMTELPQIANAGQGLPLLITSVMIIVGCVGYLIWLSAEMSMFLIVGLALVFGGQAYLRKRVKALAVETRAVAEKAAEHYQALTGGAKEMKFSQSRRNAFIADLLTPDALVYRGSNIKLASLSSAADVWSRVMMFGIIGIFLFAKPAWVTTQGAIETGFVLTLLYMMAPFRIATNQLVIVDRAKVALDRVQQLNDELSIESGSEEQRRSEGASDRVRIELQGVSHAYRGERNERFELGPLDLAVDAGEIVFLVGGNGSGKTTLAKLFCGLYEPSQGAVCINGTQVTGTNRSWYREHFSTVFSDYYLFERLLGITGPELTERATSLLQGLRLDHVVSIRDGRFSTTRLSAGQRKRLALLIAYLEDRPVVVFDEWAADQDPVFRRIFYNKLLPELKSKGKTILVISHDDQYFDVADRVIKLEFGQIASTEIVAAKPAVGQ